MHHLNEKYELYRTFSPSNIKNTISFEPFIRKKLLTPRWKTMIKCHLKKKKQSNNYSYSCWRLHFLGKKCKNHVTWRHHVGFSPKRQQIFILSMSCLCPKMTSFASYKRKIWAITSVKYWKPDIFWTVYQKKVVDPSLKNYEKVPFEEK